MNKFAPTISASLVAAALALSGCSEKAGIFQTMSEDQSSEPTKPSFTQFPDIPFPDGSEIEVSKTLVFGAGETWIGRLVVSASEGTYEMFDFYKQHLPRHGWHEITSVRAKMSVLTYARQDRIATLQIQSATIRGSQVTLTVSPRETNKSVAEAESASVAQVEPVAAAQAEPAEAATTPIMPKPVFQVGLDNLRPSRRR